MARTWPPQSPTPMIDSLRDQLLNLGVKAPDPERKPGHRPAAGKGGAGASGKGTGGAGTPVRGPGKPGGPRQGGQAAKGAGRDAGTRRGKPPGGPRRPASEMDLGKAWAMRAQHEKQERIEAEQARQEQARLRREAKAALDTLLQGKALNDASAEIARHFEYGGKIKRIYVNEAQLKALNAGELGVVQSNGRYLLVEASVLAQAEAVFAAAVALKVDPDAPAQDDPYADPRYQVPDDLVW